MSSAKKMKLPRLAFKKNKSVRPKRHVRQLMSKLLIKEVNDQQQTVDLDATRDLMRQYEEEFNDNYSAGASPSSDFGF